MPPHNVPRVIHRLQELLDIIIGIRHIHDRQPLQPLRSVVESRRSVTEEIGKEARVRGEDTLVDLVSYAPRRVVARYV